MGRLRKTTFKKFERKVFGFDIETAGDKNVFILSAVWTEGFTHTHLTKQEFIDDMRRGLFDNSVIVATNLSFDFFGVFFGDELSDKFTYVFRGSDLISATTYHQNDNFYKETEKGQGRKRIQFVDTLNYAKMGVEALGKLIGVPKMKSPPELGTTPDTNDKWKYLIEYNRNDAMVSQMAMMFFIRSFQALGANFKTTIASTAMSLFTNKYLNDTYFVNPREVLDDVLKGYYGGRTEAFHRGPVNDYFYYDVNSLYPAMMMKEYPDPNSVAVWKANLRPEIFTWVAGMALVDIECPDMKYPLLPYRSKKLYFPIGRWTAWFTHVELVEAIKAGYKIHEIKRVIAYKKMCRPFAGYVSDLYAQRLRYKTEKSPMELITKILMSSLYGKFAQKFEMRENIVKPASKKELEELKEKSIKLEPLNYGFFRSVTSDEPQNFAVPIWSAYVTAYGRLHIWRLIREHHAIYCDTDSLITKKKIPTGSGLGELKLEADIIDGIIVKPKFYFYKNRIDDREFFKAKGVHVALTFNTFVEMIERQKIDIVKFMKFKEVLRRNFEFVPNEIVKMQKTMNLEDDKRRWPGKFSLKRHEESRPLSVKEIMAQEEREKDEQRKWMSIG